MTTVARPTWAPAKGDWLDFYNDDDDTEALKSAIQQRNFARRSWTELLMGNPLINNATSSSVRRRQVDSAENFVVVLILLAFLLSARILWYYYIIRWWDDDVVFKNQSHGETWALMRFINNTIRNDFCSKLGCRFE
ncbi:hypothetical protein MLD38_034284 [Melastoma candidum]|uniref:Uncharacterized protein n=1 Tax=Melastoma candidum TaxID=119954 RepID=A0ACB9M9Z9_9MYRT|nr:hypothetical protein MLD38_034284 [Melastoma candidum]